MPLLDCLDLAQTSIGTYITPTRPRPKTMQLQWSLNPTDRGFIQQTLALVASAKNDQRNHFSIKITLRALNIHRFEFLSWPFFDNIVSKVEKVH